MRRKPDRRHRAVPSRDRKGRGADRLRVGHREEETASRERRRALTAAYFTRLVLTVCYYPGTIGAMMTPAHVLPDSTTATQTYAAFSDHRLVAAGSLEDVLRGTKKRVGRSDKPVLIFEEGSG